MKMKTLNFSLFLILTVLTGLRNSLSLALNSDGISLLSFKYLILSDPLSVLDNWNYDDLTPCGWAGVTCADVVGLSGSLDSSRVTGLALPSSSLLGSVSPDLGKIDHLRRLDLSGNYLNGSLPAEIFNATELQFLSLSNNVISGQIPDDLSRVTSLSYLNLSDNAFTGRVPEDIGSLPNLTVVCLKSNFLFGDVPSGLSKVESLDLSSNLLNGSLPADFGGNSLRYLNLSFNKVSGKIPAEFAGLIPANATVDLSFNALAGAIPESDTLLNQRKELFAGNPDLCGKPLKNLCTIPSTLSTPPNVSSSSPAIAAIPKTIDSDEPTNANNSSQSSTNRAQNGLKPTTIVGIAAADLAGIAILAAVILYVYHTRKRRAMVESKEEENAKAWSCLQSKDISGSEEGTSSEDSDREQQGVGGGRPGSIVTVDGERPELELEKLLKASAYVLGARNESIVYKALMEDGSALAVRRIGKGTDEKKRDFDANVRFIAKLRHPNLVRVRGYYWGEDEKLVVYEFVSNGSLAAANGTRRGGSSSPLHQTLEVRLKIARGIARGVVYIHEKKHVHGNIRPTNILLTSEMEPIISDFGQDRLMVSGNNNIMFSSSSSCGSSVYKPSGSARFLGSLTKSRDESSDHHDPVGPAAAASSAPPYQAPESLKNLRPSPKWDVFSFGVILLELVTGRVLSERELVQWAGPGNNISADNDIKSRALRLVDVAIRAEAESREEAVLACLKLGFSCASSAPQKRPTMKEALQVLDKILSMTSQG